ncbi:hypothetical protein VOLCADRAFT_106479 [Volvox carteri f. nagariensis]|uniref:3'-5' exonuclease domain-containing protein n=1 Tax=Volvox carteri f. nagariensis TaxID=3068 RepID=D8U7N9_VOLCA|nr:uncharacterized protein VOLCADRAFT_106479 [Volvox carteri f. nagariensis]EFJ44335.1 hypothetical protein VOLCADRAFT_106479 [Volvox carteri f. nagariensis]|eukprot:XP_002954694.1 hypothetical protein VOLCADRAFT_106479 [Volvox carteri f. nagariensis]
MTLSAALTTIAAAATAVAVVLGTRQLRRRIRPQKPFLSVFADTTDQPFPHLPPQPDDDDDDFQQRCCDSGCSSGGSGGDNTVAASTAAAPGATAAAAAAPLPEAAPGRRGAAAGGSLPAVHPYLTRIKRLMASTECPILRHPPQPPPLPPQITNQPKPPSIAPAAAAPPPPPAVAAAAQGCSTSGSRPAATRGSVLPGFQLHWVSSPKQLYWLGQRLRQERQIGLDTEASPLLCYHGRVCLIQLSVWDDTASPCDGGDDGGSSGCSSGSGGSGGGGGHVWLVDALALRGHVGAALGGLMADPRVVKVLHGGGNDVVWLQRDFRVYLVNVFDTEKASQASGGRGEGAGGRGHPEVVLHQQYPCDWCDQWRSLLPSLLLLLPGNPFEAHMCGPACFWLFLKVLGYENRALASLLSRIVGLDVGAEKAAGQRADWRRRPLPPALLRYAAADVAYLPYLADVLRRELAALGPTRWAQLQQQQQQQQQDMCGRAPTQGGPVAAAGAAAGPRPMCTALGQAVLRSHQLSLTLYKKPLSDAAEQQEQQQQQEQREEEEREAAGMVMSIRKLTVLMEVVKNGSRMPLERVRQLEGLVKAALGRDPEAEDPGLRSGDLQAALLAAASESVAARPTALTPIISMDNPRAVEWLDSGHLWHGECVVKLAMQRGGEQELMQLIKRFRTCFVEALQPQYLPPAWGVDHSARRDFGPYSVYAHREGPQRQEECGGGHGEGHGQQGCYGCSAAPLSVTAIVLAAIGAVTFR